MRLARRVSVLLVVVFVGLVTAPSIAAACRNGGWQPPELESQLMCPTCHVPLD
jgi:hypothetical protein